MIFAFPQNWRTSLQRHTLSLANTVNTGVTFDTPSGAIQNSKTWASAGFRGFGPTMTFPGAGMDGVGCGCNGGGNGGSNFLLYVFAGLGVWNLVTSLSGRRSYGD